MNEQEIATQLNHRTVRRFSAKKLSPNTIDTLISVAQHTSTSHYLQSMSLIHITDQKTRKEISQISNQSYVNGNGELFIFLVDLYRANQIAVKNGHPKNYLGSMDKFLQGCADATLAVQNVVNAAESMNLGAVILGSIQNDAGQLIKLLKLPKLTFPILGLIVGIPSEKPTFKPRLPRNLMYFQNSYNLSDLKTSSLQDYDKVIHKYYETRNSNRRQETFSHLISKSAIEMPAKRKELFKVLKHQGFFPEAAVEPLNQ